MAEVLTRRFAKALEQGSVLPDLVLIDGGRGQLNAALKVLQDLGLDYIPAVGLAKQAEEVYQPERLHPLVLDPTSPALHTLQRIRDEAHRFAITYHKKLRDEADDPVRARHDPGHRAVDPHEPAQDARLGAPGTRIFGRGAGVGAESYPKLAQRIFDHFHPTIEMEPEPSNDCYNDRSQPGSRGGDGT